MKIKNFLLAFIMFAVWGCAVNPHTGKPVITMGMDVVWDLDSIYTYESNDIANDLVVLLTGAGYTISTINKDPLLIKTELRDIGNWVDGIQTYRLAVSPAGGNLFRLKIEAINMMAPANDPNLRFTDGIALKHYNAIMDPLNAAFVNKDWGQMKNSKN